MFKLDDQHLEAAKKIAAEHRTKKNCDHCYERGWIGANEQNLLILCTRCVDSDAATQDWKDYILRYEDLKEHFADLFEEKKIEEAHPEHEIVKSHDNKKPLPANKPVFVPGQKRTGRAKKI